MRDLGFVENGILDLRQENGEWTERRPGLDI